MLEHSKRYSTHIANTKCELGILSKKDFKYILIERYKEDLMKNIKFVETTFFNDGLSKQ